VLTTTTFQYYIAHVLVKWLYLDIMRGLRVGRFLNRIKLYIRGFQGPEQRAHFMKAGLEREDHVQAFTREDLSNLVKAAGFALHDYEYFNVKNVFPSRVFTPINWVLRLLFGRSKVYGPNIALVCVKNS
jgi:hypothetical protein